MVASLAFTIGSARAPPYAPHRPESTALYRTVADHFDALVDHVREHYEKPLPRYVTREIERYRQCGTFANGFVRCHCDACGNDVLVAFSCKNRGICPSCAARRMCNTAAHLADRVIPDVPVRQWVLSLPFELRRVAAFRADVLRAIAKIFYEAIAAHYARSSAIANAAAGAVTFVQRFGGSINLNPHLHVVALDGVFTFDGGLRFHPAGTPTHDDLCAVVRRAHDRIIRWLGRRKLIDDDSEDDAKASDPTPIEACANAAMKSGTFGTAADDDNREADERAIARLGGRMAAAHNGFDLHAGVRIAAGDYEGRERLVRYGLRPCFALERLSLLPDGRVAYRVKAPRSRRATHRIMEPVEFLARLCALIPPPRYPPVRYHGVFAPNHPRRREVIPRPPVPAANCPAQNTKADPAAATGWLPGMRKKAKSTADRDRALPVLGPPPAPDRVAPAGA